MVTSIDLVIPSVLVGVAADGVAVLVSVPLELEGDSVGLVGVGLVRLFEAARESVLVFGTELEVVTFSDIVNFSDRVGESVRFCDSVLVAWEIVGDGEGVAMCVGEGVTGWESVRGSVSVGVTGWDRVRG